MGNEQKIIEKIIADAETEKAKILGEAETQANKVIKKAEELAKKEMEASSKLAKIEAEKAASKEISGAVMEAKKRVLTAKQQCMEATITKAKEKLLSLSGKDYEKTILAMLAKAEKGEEIIFSKKDRDVLADVVAAKGFQVSKETREISGGFIVKKGEIEYNYSFEAIMAVEKEEIEQIAAEILFA